MILYIVVVILRRLSQTTALDSVAAQELCLVHPQCTNTISVSSSSDNIGAARYVVTVVHGVKNAGEKIMPAADNLKMINKIG